MVSKKMSEPMNLDDMEPTGVDSLDNNPQRKQELFELTFPIPSEVAYSKRITSEEYRVLVNRYMIKNSINMKEIIAKVQSGTLSDESY